MIYCMLDITELHSVVYSEVTQDSAETVRVNLAGTQFIISFYADSVPIIAKDLDKYTHTGILSYLSDPINGWVNPINI